MHREQFNHIWIHAKLATFKPKVNAPCGLLEDHALAVRGETFAAILPTDSPEVRSHLGAVTECYGRFVTPGFIDCHTHLVWGGSRAADWESRFAGELYN